MHAKLFPHLGCTIMALGCKVFHYSVKCSKHGLRGFINAAQCRLETQNVTMLTSCWQVLSEVKLRRIFDLCKLWASSLACICKEKYGSIHEAIPAICLLIVWKSNTNHQPKPGSLGRGFVLHFHTCSAQCANRPFWPLVSKYTILVSLFCVSKFRTMWALSARTYNLIVSFQYFLFSLWMCNKTSKQFSIRFFNKLNKLCCR